MYNKAMLIGNLGKDPEIRMTQSGVKVANFPLATSESYKDKTGQKQTKTEWHKIICWDRTATLAENYLRKGSQVFIEGKITTRKWQNVEGKDVYTTEITASTIRMLGGNPARHEQQTQQPTPQNHQQQPISEQFRQRAQQPQNDPRYGGGPAASGNEVHPNDNRGYAPPSDPYDMPPAPEDDLPF